MKDDIDIFIDGLYASNEDLSTLKAPGKATEGTYTMGYTNTTVPFPHDRLGHPNHHDLGRNYFKPTCDPLSFLKDFEQGALDLLEEHRNREHLSYFPQVWDHQGGGTEVNRDGMASQASLEAGQRAGNRGRRDGYGYPQVGML